jgi:hypothetical protein
VRLANSTLICLSVPPSLVVDLCLVGLRMQPPLRFRGEEAIIAGLCKDDITVDLILSKETEISNWNATEILFCAVNLHHA